MRQTLLTGTGAYLPEKVLTNADLATFMDTDDAWIRQRTGIEKRHIVAENEMTSDLAIKAGQRALDAAELDAADLDAIIIATTTPDDTFPATAAKVQAGLNASGAFAFDVQAVCAGFVFALDTADAFIKSGKADKVLVIGARVFPHS